MILHDEDGNGDRAAIRQGDDAGVIAEAIERACLMRDRRAGREHADETRLACLTAGHDAEQHGRAALLQRLAMLDDGKQVVHRAGRGGVARIGGEGEIGQVPRIPCPR